MFRSRTPGLMALALVALALSGCQSTYHEKDTSQGPLPILRSDTRIYVGMPYDASDRKEVAFQSGKKAAEALYTAFSRNTKPVFISRGPENLSEALENARRFNANYLIYPTIKLWEDRATEWSGRRDKVEFRVDVIDLATSRNVYWKEFEAVGRFMTDGGDTPADLLQQPMDQFAATLFRRTETPSALR